MWWGPDRQVGALWIVIFIVRRNRFYLFLRLGAVFAPLFDAKKWQEN